MKILYRFLICVFLVSVNTNAQEFSKMINDHLKKIISKGELQQEDFKWEISNQHISSTSNVNHIYFYQTVNGIKISNTESSIHLLPNGEVLSSNNNFINDSSKKVRGTISTSLSAIDVTKSIADQLGYTITKPLRVLNKDAKTNQKIRISNGGISINDITAKLVYKFNESNELLLVWQVYILETNFEHSWLIFADAISGNIIDKIDQVVSCNSETHLAHKPNNNNNLKIEKPEGSLLDCEECYEVFEMPIESPYYGERSIVTNPTNNIGSPFGWHDFNGETESGYNTTRGNNINTYIGTGSSNGYQPNGGELLDFSGFDFDQDFSLENRYKGASATNLFYWGNMLHDILYIYGFDINSGNFQENNFGGVIGADDDSLYIYGQYETDFCNAYYYPSDDGDRSYIRINACGDKDGAFDNLVLVHEYAHGLTRRLIGGGEGGSICRKKETPTEGWSDWYGLMFTMSPEDIGARPRGIANYLLDQGENGHGGRIYPYTTDMNINPQTYDFIKDYTRKHNIGSVWTSILWELTWTLIDEYGYDPDLFNFTGDINQDAGNIIALAIVTESLKLVACPSGFVDARDAIIDAFRTIYEGGDECILWEAFAKRGLGLYALQKKITSVEDGIQDFTAPPYHAKFDYYLGGVCYNSDLINEQGGGLPSGGVYSGLGVIDDGNGLTFSFEPEVSGIGVHSISYEIQSDLCTIASSDIGTIEVIMDTTAPVFVCPDDGIVFIIPLEENQYSLTNLTTWVIANDNCITMETITQSPVEGTQLNVGEFRIDFEVFDSAGNMSNCSFTIVVEKEIEEIVEIEEVDLIIEIYPNPTENEIIIQSNKTIESLRTRLFDLNGRLIQTNNFNDFGFEKSLNLENLATGMYFLKIDGVEFNTVKRILKE